jgi:hypothetical protein
MSETTSRSAPQRGRGSTRGSRGGFRRTGGRNHDQSSTSQNDETDLGELGDMKKKYAAQLSQLKEMFPDWSDVDLLFALDDANGDVFNTVDHISAGMFFTHNEHEAHN